MQSHDFPPSAFFSPFLFYTTFTNYPTITIGKSSFQFEQDMVLLRRLRQGKTGSEQETFQKRSSTIQASLESDAIRGDGGTGRRRRLKISWPRGREGSSPSRPTLLLKSLRKVEHLGSNNSVSMDRGI